MFYDSHEGKRKPKPMKMKKNTHTIKKKILTMMEKSNYYRSNARYLF